MFEDCEKLKTIDLSSFDTSNVENMSYMFKGCRNLTEIILSSFNTKRVKNFDNMFEDCENMEKLDLSSFIPCKDIKMTDIFRNCKNLADLTGLESFINIFNTDELKIIFKDCQRLIARLIRENDIELNLTIEDNDKNKDIYFLDGETHDNLKELNKENTKLYIYKDNQFIKNNEDFSKKYNFNCIGNYMILLKLEVKLTDLSFIPWPKSL